MATMASFVASVLLLTSTVLAQSQVPDDIPTPTFFLSLTSNTCEYNGQRLGAGDNFQSTGSLCAYVEETNLVYSCPAPDGICWNAGETCRGGQASAGSGQTVCSNIGIGTVNWCCNSISGNCTQNRGQQNNCWSWFPNPNRDKDRAAASSSAARAIRSATSVTTNILFVSSLTSGGWEIAAAQTTPPSGSTAGVTQPTSPSSSSNDDSGLSGGAIAGIAVGAVLGGAAIAAVGFFFWLRHHKAKKNAGLAEQSQPMNQSYYEPNGFKDQKANSPYNNYASPPPQYLSNRMSVPAEMDTGSAPATHRAELPSTPVR